MACDLLRCRRMTRDHWILADPPYTSYRDYLDRTGVNAVTRAWGMTPDAVLDELERSGLRGRGGAGFPAAQKWRTVRRHPCPMRSVVCNAAEGEPGTFKDRLLLRKNPYAVLEGVLIAAHVVRAPEAYIVTQRAFVPEASRLRSAIDELRAAGLLERVTLRLVLGPEDYLFGEEKALLEVVEGGEPLPREADQPPYEIGLFATVGSPNPALVSNAQTFAHVPSIVRLGGPSFRNLGTQDTPGTILFTVCGDVQRSGVYEVPAGITLRRLFDEYAGGPLPGRRYKAALSGVAAGAIGEAQLDTPADFASLKAIGSGLGSAGFIVYDDTASLLRVAQAVARFLYVESCNQCSACKQGLRTASRALDDLFEPDQASEHEVEKALLGARSAPQGNRCYLPVQGSILIPSLLALAHDELDEHLAHPSRAAEAHLLPRLLDLDELSHTFTVDERLPFKHPDWTFPDLPRMPYLAPEHRR